MAKYYKLIAENRAARHEYLIVETFAAGIALKGTEVKSIRQGSVNLKDSFGRIEKSEIWIYGMHINPYEQGNIYNVKSTRPRKLLLNRNEMKKVIGKVSEKGLTIIPLKLYFDGNWAKLEISIAKSKKLYQKKETLKKRAIAMEISRELRRRTKET